MNRKLIRTTLAEIKSKGREPMHRDRHQAKPSRPAGGEGGAATAPAVQQHQHPHQNSVQVRKRTPPVADTHAEIFYYKKQIDAHTLMVIVLQDGEEVEGTIEWYDRGALKVNRRSAPNLMLLRHNIKYMFKAEEREP